MSASLFALAVSLSTIAAHAQQSPPSTLDYVVLATGDPTGAMRVNVAPDRARSVAYQFNDRGRGPDLVSAISTDGKGLPVRLTVKGVDYFKKPVAEVYERRGAAASWKAANDQGKCGAAGRFYLPGEATPEHLAMLARALLKAPGQSLPLLPAGRATIERLDQRPVVIAGKAQAAMLYAIAGVDFRPVPVWLDEANELLLEGDDWYATIRKGMEAQAQPLVAAQEKILTDRQILRTRMLLDRPSVPVVFTGVTLYDAETRRMRPRTTVVVRGNRIETVGQDGAVAVPADARIVPGRGRTMLPGMWDMHVHLTSNEQGLMHLAAGVTTVRDMANTIDSLLERRRRFDLGELAGPRVIMAGFIDGPGPLSAPIKMLASTPGEIRAEIDTYAAKGYAQIKLYSSLDPKLVPVAVAEAHRLGLRISGHVPAGMTMREAVEAGYDEVQHLNFAMLNFMGPDVTAKTNGLTRFTAIAERGLQLDLGSPEVEDFVALLRRRGTVIDPTVSIFENHFRGMPGKPVPNLTAVIDRLPPVVRRQSFGGGLAANDQEAARNAASFERMLQLLKKFHDAGIRIVPGTDDMPGFTYDRELELYVEAGIPVPDVLYMATLGAAQVMGKGDVLGSVAPGKLADLVLIDGSPADRVGDIRRVALIMKDGVMFDPAQLLAEAGISRADARPQ